MATVILEAKVSPVQKALSLIQEGIEGQRPFETDQIISLLNEGPLSVTELKGLEALCQRGINQAKE